MSTADELAAVVSGLRPIANDLALPDTCEVRRPDRNNPVTDSRGAKTYPEISHAVSRCRLRTGGLRPDERVVADQAEAVVPYAIDLPFTMASIASDVIVVNGTRRFDIIGVLKTEGFGVFATAIVEERT
jgi:hypothetical protein